jgi:Golgi apparatus protein 1
VCREEKDKLSKGCRAEVFKVQMAIATDYRADPEMAALCKTDIEEHCKGIKDGGGRVTACLVRGSCSSRGRGRAAR